uniref:Uncharacterized protein n=1 Tax=Ananas comosus var. bracteatus TaxID=296719 RepID=A0A6V7QD69_ANACO|nr:unnamed protein product [Ananas comosus var. bracteatus]
MRLDAISDELREIINHLEDDLPERQDKLLSVEAGKIFSSIKPQVFGNEEKEVQKHFELKNWVCASESFDVKQLIKEIIEFGTEEKESILTDLDSLQLILKEKVMSRRFILVLDDVQIKDSSEWRKLYVPLNHGLQGSMIFVTARSLEIANQLDTSYPIFLVGLTDDIIAQASDLMQSAYDLMKLEVHLELEDIGKRVAAKQDDLVFSWMALGFIAPQGNMRMEDVAMNYFQNLTSSPKRGWHGIGELKDLTQLHQSLTVKNLENVESVEDAFQAKLENKECLNELVLEWSLSRSASSRCSSYFAMDEKVLEALRPHSKLKELEIRCYRDCPNLPCPRKMVLPSSIKRLTLDSCGYLGKSLPGCLQYLSDLMYLNICCCPHIESLTGQVFHHLRALKCLYISECPKLRSLSGLEALTSLQELTILKCPHLAESESFSDTEEQQKGMLLLELTIDNTALLQFPSLRNLFSSSLNHSLNLAIWESCESVMFVGEDEEWLQILKTLRVLSFESCANLRSLPSWLRSLTSLEKLRICNCPHIILPQKENLPTSLKDLCFDD